MRDIQRQAQSVVQCRARHIQIRRPPDALLFHLRAVHADRKYIHIRGHTRRADRLGPRQIGFRRAYGLPGRHQIGLREQRSVIRVRYPRKHFHVGPPPILA
jgi:hypothetical protein